MIYFISDVHLGFFERSADSQREQLLINFLKKISNNCSKLYIVGDLFDFWFEYKTVIPKYFYRILSTLYDLRNRGIEIDYIMGNHDFGHIDFFKKELDIQVYPDDIERIHSDKKFYISHGDGKTIYDGPYNVLKKILRSPVSLKLYLKLHPNTGIKLASNTSKKSRNYTQKKDYGEVEGMEDFAFKKIDEGFDYVVMGHRHLAKFIEHKLGVYVNLGEIGRASCRERV